MAVGAVAAVTAAVDMAAAVPAVTEDTAAGFRAVTAADATAGLMAGPAAAIMPGIAPITAAPTAAMVAAPVMAALFALTRATILLTMGMDTWPDRAFNRRAMATALRFPRIVRQPPQRQMWLSRPSQLASTQRARL